MAFDFEKYIEEGISKLKIEYEKSNYPPDTEEYETSETMIEMSDGVKLKTIIYKPEGDSCFPVILQRSCYPYTDKLYRVHGEELCKRGFGFVYQYCRGTGGSEGEWVPNINERQDGYDTLIWLSQQQWTDCIGYWGASYLAFTGWAVADIVPEKVKSLYLTVYGTERSTSAYKDGLFRHDILTAWAMGNAGFEVDADYLESCLFRPHILVDEKLWGRKIDWYRDWITNTDSNAPYWKDGLWGMLSEIPTKVKIPVFIGEGWYDHHLGSALKGYEKLSQESKEHSVLNIGCWNHSMGNCIEGREVNNLQNSDVATMLQWFDETLKKKLLPKKKIRTYVIGADKWREWDTYPIPLKEELKFYFMVQEDKKNRLTEKNTDEQKKILFVYDPLKPVKSHGAESLFKNFDEVGSLKQPEIDYREDVISFVSDRLEKDYEISGKIKVKLYVSSDAEDTSFTAKIMEVFADGTTYNVRSSITTLAYRNNSEQRMIYKPNEIVDICIENWDVAWEFKKGSKIRIDISSSDFPQYAIHSNYPGVWSLQEKSKIANQTIYCGGEFASCVIMPCIL